VDLEYGIKSLLIRWTAMDGIVAGRILLGVVWRVAPTVPPMSGTRKRNYTLIGGWIPNVQSAWWGFGNEFFFLFVTSHPGAEGGKKRKCEK